MAEKPQLLPAKLQSNPEVELKRSIVIGLNAQGALFYEIVGCTALDSLALLIVSQHRIANDMFSAGAAATAATPVGNG